MIIIGVMTTAAVAACGDQGGADNGQPPPGPVADVTSSADTGTEARTPSSAPPAPEHTGIPPGLLLPNEGEGSEGPDVTPWTTDNALNTPWLLDPCRPTDYPTDDDRTGFRTVSRTGPEMAQARQLAVFASEEVAREAFAGFTRVLDACRTGGDPAQGDAWQWVVEPVEVGDEGFVAASTVGGETAAPYGNRIAVTRVGAMVFLAFDEGEYGTAAIDDGARKTQEVAETFVASL